MTIIVPVPADELPTPPSINDPINFDARADAQLLAQQAMVPQINAISTAAYSNALDAATSATQAAALVAGATEALAWVNGGTYDKNDGAISQLDFQVYRKVTATSVTTVDPSLDNLTSGGTNWTAVTHAYGNQTFTGAGVFTPKPGASYYLVDLEAGGASGACKTGRAGGAGSGERNRFIIPASMVTANQTILVGAGGASRTVGQDGQDGGDTSFGTFFKVKGGKGGTDTSGGVGGSTLTASSFQFGTGQQGATGGSSVNTGGISEWGGAGGGFGDGTLASSQKGGNSLYSAGAGAGCGGTAAVDGGRGGAAGVYYDPTGTIGTGTGGTLASPNGVNGADGIGMKSGDGGGSTYNNGTSPKGGDGGFPSAGGGAATGSVAPVSGKGGGGRLRVYWW